jgi:outer membrane protein assembly factor BamA
MKFLRTCVFLCSILIVAADSQAQPKINSLKFVGTSVFSEVTLAGEFEPLGFSAFDTARIKTGLAQMSRRYFSEGYVLFRVDSFKVITGNDSSQSQLSVFVTEGSRILVGRVNIHGNRFLSRAELTQEINTGPGKPFDQDALQQDLDYILKRYNTEGFPLAKISIDSIYMYGTNGADSLCVSIGIDEGQRIRIDAVRIEGNTQTKDYVILRALRIPPGSYYDEDELTKAKQRVQKLGFFQSVSDPEIFESGDTSGILLKVTEGNTNTFDGVIGYMPAQQGQSGYFTGLIDISMLNLFGTGRKFMAKWHQETKLTQELEIGYSEPYIFGYPINAEFDFSQRQQDTTSVTRNFGINGIFMFSDNLNGNLSVASLSTTPLLNVNNNYFVYESSVLNLGLGVVFDTRNDIYSPTRGILYSTQIQFGQKKIYGPAQLIQPGTQLTNYVQHLGVDLSIFHEFIPRQILALALHGEQLTGTELDQSDMYRVGGTNTIRGYIENQFLATKAAWTNVEYRFATGRESFFFGFVDAGYIYKQSDPVAKSPATSFSVYGYGVGAQVETGLGILKASFALGKGDSFTEGKIHFGLVNQF